LFSLSNPYSWRYALVFLSTFRYHYRHRQTNIVGECQTPRLEDYLRPLQSQSLIGFLEGLLESTRFIQWLFSLSLMNNLFGCTTKNILVIYREHPEAAKNFLTTKIIQRLKPLLYKDFVSKEYRLTVAKATESQFIRRKRSGFPTMFHAVNTTVS